MDYPKFGGGSSQLRIAAWQTLMGVIIEELGYCWDRVDLLVLLHHPANPVSDGTKNLFRSGR
jgi:hypothetical protein